MSPEARSLPVSVFLVLALAVPLGGCEPEIGSPCDPDRAKVDSQVRQVKDSNDLVEWIGFENCTQVLCASVDGSRPFCTKKCTSDATCSLEAEGFTCGRIVDFGDLACSDSQTIPNCVKPDGTPSDKPQLYCTTTPENIATRDAQFNR